MNPALISTIAINLAILLLASWVIGIVIFVRLLKDREAVENALIHTRKKLKQAQEAAKQAMANASQQLKPEFPLEPVVLEDNPDDALYLLDAFNTISQNLQEKEQQLAMMAALHAEQQSLLMEGEGIDQGIIDKHGESQTIIEKLQKDVVISQQVIHQLENKLREGQDKDGRIAILEETEKRLRDRLAKFKQNKEQAALLAEGLRKANAKKDRLIKDNEKLKRNIKELSTASQEQLATINKISKELERATQLEQHQRDIIGQLKNKLKQERASTNDLAKVKDLEQELQKVADTLERTLKEKEFIESHLLEMDKALDESKETEAALERARKEIETLEMYFPEFEPQTDSGGTPAADEAVHAPLPRLEINEAENPELFAVISDNRLFGILQEFWMTLDTPPLQMLADNNISRPQALDHWVKTSIHNDTYFVSIGTTKALSEILAKAMFNRNVSENDLKDALGELGNVIAGTLANELNPEFIVGISSFSENESQLKLEQTQIAAEVLIRASDSPIYIALAKPIENEEQ